MGYRAKRTVYKLNFEDPDYEGLEVKAYAPSIGQLLELSDTETALANATDASVERENAVKLYEMFSKLLVSWNLEHQEHKSDCKDQEDCECPWVETPPTVAGMQCHELKFIRTIMLTWERSTAGVPEGKEPNLTNGSQSQEALIPMEPLSQSLAS